jgi:antitoxin VapB
MGQLMDKAKIFLNGRSQAVRLPKDYRFKGKEVYIKRVQEGVLLMPKSEDVWESWESNLYKYDKPFLTERNQPGSQQKREVLDELYN